ncbi:MAG: hypothetical protein MUD02_07120, partial [Bacteroidales bacterium]|nr:hypothetical protein [Bacteroidales bacterium]
MMVSFRGMLNGRSPSQLKSFPITMHFGAPPALSEAEKERSPSGAPMSYPRASERFQLRLPVTALA